VPATVRLTENFIGNLRSIETFCVEHDIDYAFDRVLSALFDTLIPNLERFLNMGRPFLEREALSVEGIKLREALLTKYKRFTIREYLLERHVTLYAVRSDMVYLLAIKDFRQISYDFARIWEGCVVKRIHKNSFGQQGIDLFERRFARMG